MQRSPSVCSSSTEGPHFNPTILQSSCKTCCPGTPDPSVMEDSPAGRSSHSFLRFKRVWMKKVTPATPGSSDQISVGGKPGITEVTMVSVPCACLLTNTRFLAPISCLCQERCPPSTLPHRVSGRSLLMLSRNSCNNHACTVPESSGHPRLSPSQFFTIPHAHHPNFCTPRRFYLLPLSSVSSSYILFKTVQLYPLTDLLNPRLPFHWQSGSTQLLSRVRSP